MKKRFEGKAPTEIHQLNCMVMDFVFYATLVESRLKVNIDQVETVEPERVAQFK